MTPFDTLLQKALDTTGVKSWVLYWKVWSMKALWGFTSRKFQALCMAIAYCLIFQADTWIIVSCLVAYSGSNVAEKLFKRG